VKLREPLLDLFHRSGIMELLGKNCVFNKVRDAIAAYQDTRVFDDDQEEGDEEKGSSQEGLELPPSDEAEDSEFGEAMDRMRSAAGLHSTPPTTTLGEDGTTGHDEPPEEDTKDLFNMEQEEGEEREEWPTSGTAGKLGGGENSQRGSEAEGEGEGMDDVEIG